MAEMDPRTIDHPVTEALGEALLLQKDIQTSIDAINIWHDYYAEKPDRTSIDKIIELSLFRDAVVQFIGCFDKSNKYRLDETEIYGADPNGLPYFQWMNNIRNAYAAHKHGAQRQALIGVMRDPVTGTEGVVGMALIYEGPPKAAHAGPHSFHDAGTSEH
jgi:hypothetical protein